MGLRGLISIDSRVVNRKPICCDSQEPVEKSGGIKLESIGESQRAKNWEQVRERDVDRQPLFNFFARTPSIGLSRIFRPQLLELPPTTPKNTHPRAMSLPRATLDACPLSHLPSFVLWGNQSVLMALKLNQKDCHSIKRAEDGKTAKKPPSRMKKENQTENLAHSSLVKSLPKMAQLKML